MRFSYRGKSSFNALRLIVFVLPVLASAQSNLSTFKAALNNASSEVVNVVIWDDSLSRCWGATGTNSSCPGFGPVDQSALWTNELTAYLQQHYGSHGTGIVTFVSGINQIDYGNWSPSGTTSFCSMGPEQSGTSAGAGCLQLSPGASVTMTSAHAGDTIKVYYGAYSPYSSNGFTVSDSGTVLGSSYGEDNTGSGPSQAHVVSISVGSGNHTPTVTCNSNSASGAACYLYGLEITNGTTGVSVHNLSIGACRTDCFAANLGTTYGATAWANLISGGRQLDILALGTNDYLHGSLSTYNSNMASLISSEQTAGVSNFIVWSQPWVQSFVSASSGSTQAQFNAAAASIASSDSLNFNDVASFFVSASQMETDNYVNSDGIHLDDAGQEALSGEFENHIFANQSAVFTSGNGGLVPTRPHTAAYTAQSQTRYEFRISDVTSSSLASLFAGDVPLSLRMTNATTVTLTDATSTIASDTFPSGATDVLVKAQRYSSGQMCIEIWEATNTNHYTDECQASTAGAYNMQAANLWLVAQYSATFSGNMAFFRWFSTTTPLGAPPNPNAVGGLGDWELDGNGNDSSGNGLNVTLGSSSYTPTLTYAPSVSFPNASNCFLNNSLSYLQGFCTFASSSITLTSGAYTPNQGDSLTYTWTQASGPVSGAISGSTTETPTISGLSQFGEYDFQLTATDSEANSGAATLPVGIVTVGGPQNCIVSDVPTNLQYLVGPLTPWGSSCDLWPWYDIAEVANANVLQSTFTVPTETSESGTVVVNTATSPPTLQGAGTSFTTLPHSYDGSGCDLGVFILLHWNAEGGNGTGRALMQLSNGSGAACDGTPHYLVTNDSNWQITSPQTSQLPPGLGSTGYSFTSVNINDLYVPYSVAQNGVGGNYSWNYYDNVIAFYRLYFRTGITAYLTYARRLADAWWSYALDHGYSAAPAFPRLLGLPGMMARAIDGHSERWPGIENKTGGGPQGAPNPPGNLDFRETGYSESYVSLLTALDPNITGNPTTQATYCGYVASSITGFWTPVLSFGYKTLSYSVNNGYPTYGYEIEPWQLPITASGLRDAYRVLNGSNCNDPTDAATALSYTIQTANYAYQTGAVGFRNIPASNGGGQGRPSLAYITGTPTSAQNVHQPCATGWSGVSPCTNGTVSISLNGTTVTGSGTSFLSTFACNGTDYIGIIGEVQATSSPYSAHKVLSCQSDTQLTIPSDNAGVATISASNYQESPGDATTACAPSQADYCWGVNVPDQSTDAAEIFGWIYQLTKDPAYRVWGDDMFSAAYGGPASGPGTTGPPAGPMSAATANNDTSNGQPITDSYGYVSALPDCRIVSPPCGGLNTNPPTVPIHWGKDFGIGSGWAGAMDNYLAYRVLGQPPYRWVVPH